MVRDPLVAGPGSGKTQHRPPRQADAVESLAGGLKPEQSDRNHRFDLLIN